MPGGDEGRAIGERCSISLPRPTWYPACTSKELGRRRPRAIELMGAPLVVVRDGRGEPGVLVDRCPHRNAPLSAGRVHQGSLERGSRGFGGEQCSSTEMDLFGSAVWRLLRHAERGDVPPVIEPREVTFRA